MPQGAVLRIEADVTVVAPVVDDANERRFGPGLPQEWNQFCLRCLDIFGKTFFCKIQLIGSIDEFDRAIDVVFDIVIDVDTNAGCPKKIDIAAAGCGDGSLLLFELLVFGQSGQLRIVLALERGWSSRAGMIDGSATLMVGTCARTCCRFCGLSSIKRTVGGRRPILLICASTRDAFGVQSIDGKMKYCQMSFCLRISSILEKSFFEQIVLMMPRRASSMTKL